MKIFRRVRFNRNDNFSAVLYKNCREAICEIPSEFIDYIEYNLTDCSTLSITIPNIIKHNNKVIENSIYNKIAPKRFIVINDNERFIINEIKESSTKEISKKTITAKSFEFDLLKKDVMISDGTRQLYRDKNDEINLEPGILNFLEEQTTWKIGYVDPDAKNSNGLYPETCVCDLFEKLKIDNIKRGSLLFERDIKIDITNNTVLSFNIKYLNICSIDTSTNIQKTENYDHSFDNFSQPITKIKAIYDVDSNYNPIVKYEFTLLDGFIQKINKDFAYLENLNSNFQKIYLEYETGSEVIKNKTKFRSFDKATHQWLTFLRDDISKAFDCLFQFDTLNKKVNVYSNDNIGADNGFYLYYDQFLISTEKDFMIDEVITRLIVEGKDGISINGVNPLGTNYIEDFSYLLKQGNISEELIESLNRYKKYIEKINTKWIKEKQDKQEKNKQAIYLEAKLKELQEKLSVYNAIKVSYLKNGENNELTGDELKKVLDEIEKLNKVMADILKELTKLKEEIKMLDEKMCEYNKAISKDKAEDEYGKIFTMMDLNELDECIYSTRMQDDYYTDERELFNSAKMLLSERNKIPIKITTNVAGITKHPRGWRNIIRLGDKAHLTNYKNEMVIDDKDLRVVSFKYIPPKKSAPGKVDNIKLNNQKVDLHDLKTIRNVARKADYSKSTISLWKNTWVDSSSTNTVIQNIKTKGLDTSKVAITSRSNTNQTDIIDSGIWCTDKTDGNTNKQMYIGQGFISVTNDNWNNCRVIADDKGVVANNIFGTGVLGEKMNLANPENTFRIDKQGMSLYDSKNNMKARFGFYEVNGESKSSFIMYGNDGKVIIGGDGMSQLLAYQKNDNLDNEHSMKMKIFIPNKIKEIRDAIIFIHLDKYRTYLSGVREAGKGQITTSIDSDGMKYFTFNNSSNDIDTLGNIANFSTSDRESITTDIYNDETHNHMVEVSDHNHEPIFSISETTMPKDVKVIINGVTAATNINEDIELNIKNFLYLNKLNVIEFKSNTNGLIDSLVYLDGFVSF
ncbi:MAG: hypothetical protein RR942_14575 [Romboutsia sp.]